MKTIKKSTLFAIAAVSMAGLALAGCSGSDPQAAPTPQSTTTTVTASPPAGTSTPVTPSTPVPTTTKPPAVKPAPPRKFLGPNGYGKLRMGMTAKQALATGEVRATAPAPNPPPGCSGYSLVDDKARPSQPYVTISPKYGVIAINGLPGIRTPEGIGVGSTVAQVRKAYPDLEITEYSRYATVPGNRKLEYHFSFGDGQKVIGIRLEDSRQDCYG